MFGKTLPGAIVGALALAALTTIATFPGAQPLPPGIPDPGIAPPTQPVAANAALRFPKPLVDFGSVVQDEKVDIVFPVQNTSDRVVNIVDIQTGCGCTSKSETNPKSLAPGQSANITVTFDTHGRRGDQHRTINISTDDVANRFYNVSFKGMVVAPLYYSTNTVDFGPVPVGQGGTRQFSLYSTMEDFEVTSVAPSDNRFTLKQVETKPFQDGERSGKEYVFEVGMPADLAPGDYRIQAMIETSAGDKFMQRVLISARVVGNIQINPQSLFVNLFRESEPTSRTITVRSNDNKPFEIQKITIPESIGVTSETINDGPNVKQIVFTFKPFAEVRTMQETAVLEFRIEGVEQVEKADLPLILITREQRPRVVRPQPVLRSETTYNPSGGAIPPQAARVVPPQPVVRSETTYNPRSAAIPPPAPAVRPQPIPAPPPTPSPEPTPVAQPGDIYRPRQ